MDGRTDVNVPHQPGHVLPEFSEEVRKQLLQQQWLALFGARAASAMVLRTITKAAREQWVR